ncbi:uncharacterized protein PFL1_00502 [Pseudozyma flocculosa PF-1]|nr:uncharacterized protein PFL1_00502 [Pseudozyma flocculosa PF-1]EPQ32306.1 hypothetical protein PFL1_00502 [Pseudozyma flocculosa PF-1]
MAVGVASGSHDDASPSNLRRHHQKREMQHLVKRAYNGDATWYDVETGNAGACGQMLKESDFVVAINQPQYGSLNQKSSWCGKTITISANGKSTQARVADACPTGGGNCGFGSLDMSKSLFQFFNPLGVGKFSITWTEGGGGGGNVVDNVVSAVTGKKKNKDNNNNNDDNNDWWAKQQQKKKEEEAAAQQKQQEEEAQKAKEAKAAADQAAAEKEAEAASSRAAASASKSASRASVQASKSSAAAASASAASASSAARASATKAAARASSSAAAASKSEARASASAARVAATAVPTGNLDKFDELFNGLSNIVQNQAA